MPCLKVRKRLKMSNDQLKTCPLKAFKTNFDDFTTIVFARSRSKAQYANLKSANDAGYQYKFGDMSQRMHTVRAKQFDGLKLKEGHCYGLDYVSALNTRTQQKEIER